jgi:hypothetical protein
MGKRRAVARNFLARVRTRIAGEGFAMRGERSTTFTDGSGRRWRVRELVRPAATAMIASRRVPALTHATLVFESRGERRFAHRAPLDWREHRGLLTDLFAKAKRSH